MRSVLIRLCCFIPVLMLAANALSWLRYGTDFPFFDDWRAYATGDIQSLDLKHLFQVVNNTMSPVGFALDALAQRWLDGNTVAYQLLSMLTVLGGLLWLQWKLLSWAVPHPLVRAVSFAFTVFMLQSATYWGEQNLAYQQALPLLFLLGALYFILISELRLVALAVVVALLGVLAGFSYISGAVSALVMGSILLFVSAFVASLGWAERSEAQHGSSQQSQCPEVPARLESGLVGHRCAQPSLREDHSSQAALLKERVRLSGLVLLLVGAAITAFQFYATRIVGGADRSEAFPVRWPTHPDFWAYLLGKVGRSFGSAFQNVTHEMVFALVVAVALGAVLLVYLKCFVQKRSETPAADDWHRIACIYLPLAGAVMVYLSLVAFGRSGFRDASIQSLPDVFQFAYQRFHFFWITLLFPWTVAALLTMLCKKGATQAGTPSRNLPVLVALSVLLIGWGLAGTRGVFDVSTYYEQGRQTRANTIRCMSQQLGSGEPIMCPEFALPGWTDWTPAYLHARQIGASFTKYFPLVEHDPPRRWLFEGVPVVRTGVSWRDADETGGGWRQGRADPQLLIEDDGDAHAYANCRMLDVRLRLRSEKASIAQVFFRPVGVDAFSEALSRIRPVATSSDRPQELHFAIESPEGFAPVIRIDPVQGDSRFVVEYLRIGCGLSAS